MNQYQFSNKLRRKENKDRKKKLRAKNRKKFRKE